jgi:hypothetical protein
MVVDKGIDGIDNESRVLEVAQHAHVDDGTCGNAPFADCCVTSVAQDAPDEIVGCGYQQKAYNIYTTRLVIEIERKERDENHVPYVVAIEQAVDDDECKEKKEKEPAVEHERMSGTVCEQPAYKREVEVI